MNEANQLIGASITRVSHMMKWLFLPQLHCIIYYADSMLGIRLGSWGWACGCFVVTSHGWYLLGEDDNGVDPPCEVLPPSPHCCSGTLVFVMVVVVGIALWFSAHLLGLEGALLILRCCSSADPVSPHDEALVGMCVWPSGVTPAGDGVGESSHVITAPLLAMSLFALDLVGDLDPVEVVGEDGTLWDTITPSSFTNKSSRTSVSFSSNILYVRLKVMKCWNNVFKWGCSLRRAISLKCA